MCSWVLKLIDASTIHFQHRSRLLLVGDVLEQHPLKPIGQSWNWRLWDGQGLCRSVFKPRSARSTRFDLRCNFNEFAFIIRTLTSGFSVFFVFEAALVVGLDFFGLVLDSESVKFSSLALKDSQLLDQGNPDLLDPATA